MNLIRKFSILLCLSAVTLSSYAQFTTTIPLHEGVKTGTLKNGLKYFILHNEEPKDRASFYFVQNVGAILEEENQNGLAHFLEHMAFNGTEHYKGKGFIDYLEGKGIKFGRDINAYTAQDKTVYNISNIPVQSSGLIDSTLLVLHDWSGSLLLEDKEIEAERGVIHEEWRTRRNVRKRLGDQASAVIYNNSMYAKRDVIGSLDVIDHFKPATLRQFYKKWYRPDLQAVVVVGDINVEEVEAKVIALFSDIPLIENPKERTYCDVPDSKELGYVVAKDKEAKNLSIKWLFRNDIPKVRDEAYFRKSMLKDMFVFMFGSRLSEKTKKLECPALSMGTRVSNFTRTKASSFIYVKPKKGKEREAFATLYTELERLVRYGFTTSELERTKKEILSFYKSYYANRDKIGNDKWAELLGNYFLKAQPFPSVDWEMDFATKTIPAISVEEINTVIKNFSNIDNSALIVSGPDNEEQYYPTKSDLCAIVAKIKSQDIKPYDDSVDETPLIEKELKEAKITSIFNIKGIDAKGYILSNGARVLILPTDYSKDKISFSSFSFGGRSLIATKDLASAGIATTVVDISGLGKYDVTQLGKKLAGKTVSLSSNLGNLTEGFNGSSTPQDFETLLQLLYLNFESPRFDKDAYRAEFAKWENYVVNKSVDNAAALKDSVVLANTNHSDRTLLYNKDFLADVNFNKAVEIYKDRFSDASDFTFIFVGNIDLKKHLPLIQKYIGNITSTNRNENFIDNIEGPAKGKTSTIFARNMTVPKTTVYYSLKGKIDYNLKNKMMVSMISQLLSKRYMVTIREEEGGSYGVGVHQSVSKMPKENFSIAINFDCNPEKCERLMDIIREEIAKITTQSCEANDLMEIKNNFLKSRDEAELQDNFWMSTLYSNQMTGARIINKEEYKKIVSSIDAKSIEKLAKKIFKKADIVEVIMNPDKQ